MASGITIQKNYVSSNLTDATLANNWTVLVLGVTSQGPTTPTLVRSYSSFTKTFGQPVNGVLTHNYVQLLLNSGVPVLFKRIIDVSKLTAAFVKVPPLFTIKASENYLGKVGENIRVTVAQNSKTNVCNLNVYFNGNLSDSYSLGIATNTTTLGDLLYSFILANNVNNANFNNEYVTFIMDEVKGVNPDNWKSYFASNKTYTYDLKLADGGEGEDDLNTLAAAIDLLKTYKNNSFWQDVKLLNAAVYYPQLRFITSGGIISKNIEEQNTINENMGKFATASETSFRVLIDYSCDMVDINTVRSFAQNQTEVPSSVYAYFGYWGSDSSGTWLPGSAGFLSALGLSGYNVYSRRIAGSSFTPAFTKPYENIYIDALNSWQSDELIQLNPIITIDAQDNLAVMGSSTLALPLASTSARNPAQALDVVLVGDYVAAILNGIALKELESALERLSLNSLSNKMSQEVERFVTSRAITRYDFTFDTTQLGRLGINCTLYFAVGLEEVALTVTSVYDVTATIA